MVILLCAGLVGLIFTGELLLKNHVERRELPEGERELLGGRLLLRKYHNRGMAFGIGEGNRRFVTVLSVMLTVLAALVLILSFGQRGNGWLRIGLSLLLGGAFSNTYDRLKRRYVVDYFSFGVRWKPLRNLVFNISDFCILTGALLAALGAAQ